MPRKKGTRLWSLFLSLPCAGGAPWEFPSWVLGPFERDDEPVNPVLSPLSDSFFPCPVTGNSVAWEAKDVFNPSAVVDGGKVHLLYRAEDHVGPLAGTSRIGLASSVDGTSFQRRDAPVLFPANDSWKSIEWPGGLEVN